MYSRYQTKLSRESHLIVCNHPASTVAAFPLNSNSNTSSNSMDAYENISEIASCDYVRWGYADVHGNMRGKIIPGRHCAHFFEEGKGAYPGGMAIGPANENIEVPELIRRNFGNGFLKPDLKSFHLIPWSGTSGEKVGELMCSFYWADGSPVLADSRHTALRQLDQLKKEGLELSSAFEYEFRLFKVGTQQPIAQRRDPYSILLAQQNEGFLFALERNLRGAGVDLEQIHSEYGYGQYEATMPPLKGIDAADKAMIYREGVREIAGLHNMTASFMSLPFSEDTGNGCHFNHSLWNLDGKNVFYDEKVEHGMSSTLNHWIAGQLEHARSLTALFSPTVNCYRRLHRSWAPDYVDWGIDDRAAAYRIRVGTESSTYVENRQPSSCANAYSVLAATVAAGLDGIRRKLEPSAPSTRHQGQLPFSLAEALQALQDDAIMVEALGKDFIEWFVATKEQSDLKKFRHHNMEVAVAEELVSERDEYLIYL